MNRLQLLKNFKYPNIAFIAVLLLLKKLHVGSINRVCYYSNLVFSRITPEVASHGIDFDILLLKFLLKLLNNIFLLSQD